MKATYFDFDEMKCKGKDCCGGVAPMDSRFMEVLDTLRSHVGPLRVNSGFRCRNHNTKVGGSSRSKHMEGIAADIVPVWVDLEYLKNEAEMLGLYCIMYDSWLHVDGRHLENVRYG